MKILSLAPPYTPSYFNAGHHLPVFSVGAYLRGRPGVDSVVCVDAAALNSTWKDLCDLLLEDFDVIAVLNDFDGVDTFGRLASYVAKLSGHSRLVTYGRLSKQIPGYFERFGFDGIVSSGDYEAGVAAFVDHLRGEEPQPPGVALRGDGYRPPREGRFLDPEEWVLPDVTEIPYAAYERLYARDFNKFCGIPERRELVVPVARGCPVNCAYCDVPAMQGLRERRLDVGRTLAYIEDAFRRERFEYVSFYAPTFTLNRRWVRQLCGRLVERGSPYPWKCATTLFHLDEDLIAAMARSGCVRISIGLETLDPGAKESLPKAKRDCEQRFDEIGAACRRVGVELNCFVMMGLPGDSLAGVRYTIEKVHSHGGRVRPTIYTPYHLMRDDMSAEEVAEFNRQTFVSCAERHPDERGFYELFYRNRADRETDVMQRVPERLSNEQRGAWTDPVQRPTLGGA